MSWFLRGAQSALFYYASCTPWHKYKHQRRRKQQNTADRAAREAYERALKQSHPYGTGEADPEMLYRQPSPQATNEFWTDEIRMGPGPPPKRAKKSKGNKDVAEPGRDLEKELETGLHPRPPDIVVDEDQDETIGVRTNQPKASDDIKEEHPKSKVEIAQQRAQEEAPRASNLSRKSSARVSAEDPKWNHRRFYQREDEALWGVALSSANPTVSDVNLNRTRSSTNTNLPAHPLPAASRPQSSKSPKTRPHAPSTASTASLTTLRSQLSTHLNVHAVAQGAASTESIYTAPRAPPINDDHPPVANNPLHSKKVLTKWMLQPTPSPSVMSGKKQVRRGTVGSTDSGGSVTVSVPPSRNGSGQSSLRRDRPEKAPAVAVDNDAGGGSMRRQLSARLLAVKLQDSDQVDQLVDEMDNDADVEED